MDMSRIVFFMLILQFLCHDTSGLFRKKKVPTRISWKDLTRERERKAGDMMHKPAFAVLQPKEQHLELTTRDTFYLQLLNKKEKTQNSWTKYSYISSFTKEDDDDDKINYVVLEPKAWSLGKKPLYTLSMKDLLSKINDGSAQIHSYLGKEAKDTKSIQLAQKPREWINLRSDGQEMKYPPYQRGWFGIKDPFVLKLDNFKSKLKELSTEEAATYRQRKKNEDKGRKSRFWGWGVPKRIEKEKVFFEYGPKKKEDKVDNKKTKEDKKAKEDKKSESLIVFFIGVVVICGLMICVVCGMCGCVVGYFMAEYKKQDLYMKYNHSL